MKKRLDVLMVEKGVADSRQKAQALLMTGNVRVNGIAVQKASQQMEESCEITITEGLKFVSRGGLKLEKAFSVFPINVKDKPCGDIGASTGGFTDCMLQAGARKVYSIDVGYGQLDWKLRNDARVVVMERTNARFIKPEDFDDLFEFVGVDASFISMKLLLPAMYNCMAVDAQAVVLIKPQFEAGKGFVGKNGVVRDKKVHVQVIEDVISHAREVGFQIAGLDFSPITGPKGNIEFLAYLKKSDGEDLVPDIPHVVDAAHESHRS